MKDKDFVTEALEYIRWVAAFVIFCFALSSWGCAAKERAVVEYKDVYIPVKCRAEVPQKPEPAKNPVEMNLLILKYAESLEAALRSCL